MQIKRFMLMASVMAMLMVCQAKVQKEEQGERNVDANNLAQAVLAYVASLAHRDMKEKLNGPIESANVNDDSAELKRSYRRGLMGGGMGGMGSKGGMGGMGGMGSKGGMGGMGSKGGMGGMGGMGSKGGKGGKGGMGGMGGMGSKGGMGGMGSKGGKGGKGGMGGMGSKGGMGGMMGGMGSKGKGGMGGGKMGGMAKSPTYPVATPSYIFSPTYGKGAPIPAPVASPAYYPTKEEYVYPTKEKYGDAPFPSPAAFPPSVQGW
jgi:hypothetical protein